MSLMIRVAGTKAIFRDGQWVSCDRLLEDRLNQLTASWIEQTGGPGIGDRDPEWTCAQTVAQLVEGIVVRHIPVRGDRMRSMFLARRQMRLF